jgi:hypothetical protein
MTHLPNIHAEAAGPLARRYLDDLVDDYVSWREACAVVSETYDNWKRARGEHEKLAFSEYIAALNCEEEAAALYQQSVERLAAMPSA